ncbi:MULTISPECIES: serine hydrolase [unclassified Arthrobacter]|uniref:serine hydrolase domain-containing protein n=1 Tax=unclassified Arthrobacter TaxID=235627 RepID=UPI001C859ACA|nr:serine hydrolase [Arthrobacter sp. MAHUQ-56]MBX7446029.1 beta-lactamase family protein [Arthrobacter sp. MAHUQ-56]
MTASHAPALPVPRNTSSLLVLRNGATVVELGDTTRASYVASMRKSLLSILFGIQVAAGRGSLDATLGDLAIDDVGGLLPIERTARLRDLLTSRSGVYHPPSSPGSDEHAFPARGTRTPGQYFLYNNWDFNAAGGIFEKISGLTVFEAFEKHLAGPLGFEDFESTRQLMLGDAAKSAFPAYHLFLSARDLARIGLLMAAEGWWEGRQLVPREWIRKSVSTHVRRADMAPATGFGNCDYGYLWWLPREADPKWDGAFLAAGNYGQFLLVLPAIRGVIVHRRFVSDSFAIARNTRMPAAATTCPGPVTHTEFMDLARALVDGPLAG